MVIGGCAVILHGYFRTTHDIDLLVEPSPENIGQLKKTLSDLLGSEEVFEIRDDDIARYAVHNLLSQGHDMAVKDIEEVEVEGTKIPLCGLSTLIATKQGVRPKDKEDLLFLIGKKEYLEKQSRNVQ